MLLAILFLQKYSAIQIVNALTIHYLKNKTMYCENLFKCNYNNIFKAEKYFILIK